MINMNCIESLSDFRRKLKNHSEMTFSTSSSNRVSSRQVSVIIFDGKFYFQTDEKSLKFRQLSENPNASFNFQNYSVEGKCRCIGSPAEKENAFFLSLFKKHFFIAYKLYSHLPDERLIEFSPTLIYSWGYEITKPFMEYWDLGKQTYEKKYME